MEIEIREHITRVVVISPVGRLDAFSAPALRDQLANVVTDSVQRVVIDLTKTAFLDSAGMAVLVSALKRARATGGDTYLVRPGEPAAMRVLTLTKFDKVFKIFDSESEAVEAF